MTVKNTYANAHYNPNFSRLWNKRHRMWYGNTDPRSNAHTGMVGIALAFPAGLFGGPVLAAAAFLSPILISILVEGAIDEVRDRLSHKKSSRQECSEYWVKETRPSLQHRALECFLAELLGE